MRSATRRIVLCAAGAALSACARRELEFQGSRLPLALRLDTARVEVPDPLPLSDLVAEVLWVRDGLAGIVVELGGDDGAAEPAGGRMLTRWTLPLLPAPLEAGGPDLPELEGLPLPLLEPGGAGERANGFWIEPEGRLAVVSARGRERPERLSLRYTVYAAQLAGTALGAGFAPGELFAVRARHGDTSAEALAIPAGATLSLTLPPLPAGRLAGAFTAAVAGPDAPLPEVALRLGGEELFRGLPGPHPDGRVELGTAHARWIELPGAYDERTLSIEVEGSPGDLVLFEAPCWSRPRRWNDGQNVLLVVVNSLRADRLLDHGNQSGITPNLDRFADDALRFDQAWATSSFTLSSVASMLTSTYGAEHQAWLPDRRLGRGVTTLAEVFRDAGYQTAAVTEGGFVSPPFGVDRGFMTFDGESGGVQETVERARAFLDRAGAGPWFLFLHTYELHAPYEPPQAARERIERKLPNALRGMPPDPRSLAPHDGRPARIPDDTLMALRALYDEEVRFIDGVLGELLEDLRARKLYDDALVCITSDHGEEFGEHGGLGHGDSLYPEVMQVPLLLKLPRRGRAGLAVREPVSLIDLAPTLLDGSELEGLGDGAGFNGVSLLSADPSLLYADRNHPEVGLLAAIRREHYVMIQGGYVTPRRADMPELYNLRSDPWAMENVARSDRAALQQARKGLMQLEERYGATRVEGVELVLEPDQRARLERFR